MLYVDIEKKLDHFTLRVKLDIRDGSLALFGPSGAGKSMTLKCIAGIEKPDKGVIRLGDLVLFDSERHINLPPQERRVGYLFQEYALFPNMTVTGNIKAGLHNLKRVERNERARELLQRFRIEHLAEKRPDTLSGGERQRVALARIFASSPEVLLLDEPFSSLDTFLKWELIPEMKDILHRFGKCSIMVSHDVDEVCRICDAVSTILSGVCDGPKTASAFFREVTEKYDSMGILPMTLRPHEDYDRSTRTKN